MRVPWLVVGLSILAACASAPARPVGVDSAVVMRRVVGTSRIVVMGGAGDLTSDQMRALVPRIRAVQLEQGATSIAPGDTFTLQRFSIRLLDSAGATLGRTHVYDFALANGAAALEPPPIVRGVKEGESQARISFPRRLWVGRTDPPPETFLRIVVRPRPVRTAGMGGNGTLTGRVHASYAVNVTLPDSGPRRALLRYVVLWRAQPEWCRRPCGDDDGSAADSLAALRRAIEARGNQFSGSSSGGVAYGFEIDNRTRRLIVLDQTVPFGVPDSAAVVLVDRVDAVGGPPVVVRIFRIPALLSTDFTATGRNADPFTGIAIESLLRDALRRSPVAREFMDDPPPRIPAPLPGRRAD